LHERLSGVDVFDSPFDAIVLNKCHFDHREPVLVRVRTAQPMNSRTLWNSVRNLCVRQSLLFLD
jgi:hypothetical protein